MTYCPSNFYRKKFTLSYKLLPVLYQALVDLEVMPKRKFSSAAELKETLEGVEKILIDVTERNYRRSQDDEKQR